MGQAHRLAAAAALILLSSAAPAQEPPDAVYRKLHTAALGSNLNEMLRYATEERRREIAALPAAAETVKLMAMMMPRNYTVTGTNISADGMTAQLRATGTGTFMGSASQMHGTANFMKEKGEWKVDKWEWSDKPGGAPMAPVRVQKAPALETPAAIQQIARKPIPAAPPPDPTPAGTTRTQQPTDCVIKPVMSDDDLRKCGASTR